MVVVAFTVVIQDCHGVRSIGKVPKSGGEMLKIPILVAVVITDALIIKLSNQ